MKRFSRHLAILKGWQSYSPGLARQRLPWVISTPRTTLKELNRNRPRGFTLIEMVVTLVVFILLVACVFGIITAVLQTTNRLADDQGRHDQNSALQAFLRLKFREIPADGILQTYRRDGDASNTSGITWGDETELTAIDSIRQPNGLRSVRLARYFPPTDSKISFQGKAEVFQNMILQDDASLTWVPLARDLKLFDWKFLPEGSTIWQDHWDVGMGIFTTGSNTGPFFPKPNLVELTLQNAADLQPVTLDLWLPKIEPVEVTVQQTSSAVTTPITTVPHAQ